MAAVLVSPGARPRTTGSAWHVALLRGVNVGGHNRVAMADLRNLLGRLGLEEASSLLQSGNLAFRGGGRPAAELERLLEREARTRFQLETTFFVRTADEWKDVIAGNPFPEQAAADPARLMVVALKEAPAKGAERDLRAAIHGPESVRLRGREAYAFYPLGMGKSRFTINLIEKVLGTQGTARNWNTVVKLGLLAPEGSR